MKRESAWLTLVAAACLAAAAVVYALEILVFHKPRETVFLMFQDFAFLPLSVLLVVVIIERLLARREKMERLRKLNMVIGTFFSEIGLALLRTFAGAVRNGGELRSGLNIRPDWTARDFQAAAALAGEFPYQLDAAAEPIERLRSMFAEKRGFLVSLLENPNLLEHERFTDVLWAVFHLAEELSYREGPAASLPRADLEHLTNDVRRAGSRTTAEWITYAEHLKTSYPFLFSLAVRINPFSTEPSAVITS